MEYLENSYLKELTVDKDFRNIFLFIRDRCLQDIENYYENDLNIVKFKYIEKK